MGRETYSQYIRRRGTARMIEELRAHFSSERRNRFAGRVVDRWEARRARGAEHAGDVVEIDAQPVDSRGGHGRQGPPSPLPAPDCRSPREGVYEGRVDFGAELFHPAGAPAAG